MPPTAAGSDAVQELGVKKSDIGVVPSASKKLVTGDWYWWNGAVQPLHVPTLSSVGAPGLPLTEIPELDAIAQLLAPKLAPLIASGPNDTAHTDVRGAERRNRAVLYDRRALEKQPGKNRVDGL